MRPGSGLSQETRHTHAPSPTSPSAAHSYPTPLLHTRAQPLLPQTPHHAHTQQAHTHTPSPPPALAGRALRPRDSSCGSGRALGDQDAPRWALHPLSDPQDPTSPATRKVSGDPSFPPALPQSKTLTPAVPLPHSPSSCLRHGVATHLQLRVATKGCPGAAAARTGSPPLCRKKASGLPQIEGARRKEAELGWRRPAGVAASSKGRRTLRGESGSQARFVYARRRAAL